ncbi:MAG: hypothetical protein ABJA34_05115 [Pseudonocardiales bacterium]
MTTAPEVKTFRAVEPISSREWSSMTSRISASVPPASGQWVTSACQHSLS